MQNFYEWLDKKDLWVDLFFHLLEADDIRPNKGVYQDKSYHNNLVRKLRVLGLGEDADELEMIKMSQEDIDHSNSAGSHDHKKKMSARLAYNTYMDHIDHLIKKTNEYIDKMGWKQDVEKQLDSRISKHPGEEDYDQYGI